MKARQMGHFKLKLIEISRELYLEHGWKMPQGLAKTQPRNPLNYSLAEWQQAKRIARDPVRIKKIFQDTWAVADSGSAFRQALEDHGYYLARGDRRGFVAVDWQGEVYSLSRWCGVPTKVINDRLAPLSTRTVDEAASSIAARVEQKLQGFDSEMKTQFEAAQRGLREQRIALVSAQRQERQRLNARLSQRWNEEQVERAGRLRKGLLGLWDWVTGRKARIIESNEREVEAAKLRDREERQELIDRQLDTRRGLQREIQSFKIKGNNQAERLQSSAAHGRMNVPTMEVPPPMRRRPQSLDR